MKHVPAPVRGLAVVLATALAYAVLGGLSLSLAVAPSYASPIYLAAGLALAAAITFGRHGVLGAALGALAIQSWLGPQRGLPMAPGLATALGIALGVGAQAALGMALVRRFVGRSPTLAEPRELFRFVVLGAPIASLVSASVATLAMTAAGVVPASQGSETWGIWWTGDTLGVLIAAPIVLTFIGRPQSEWRRRRLVVALPMLAASLLLAAATAWIIAAHDKRVRTAFERDAWALGERVDAQLKGPQRALLAMHALFDTQQRSSPRRCGALRGPGSRTSPICWPSATASGCCARTSRPSSGASTPKARRPDLRGLRPAGGPLKPPPTPTCWRSATSSRWGPTGRRWGSTSARSRPPARHRRGRAQRQASGQRRLPADPGQRRADRRRALPAPVPGPADRRRRAPGRLRGTVFVTLRLDAMLTDVLADRPNYLDWCLSTRHRAWPGRAWPAPRAASPPPRRRWTTIHVLDLAGRPLRLRVWATADSVPGLADGGAWAFSVAGLLSISWLGALLLIVSGRQQRIETAVAERTADLQAASHALRESQERLRNIVDHVPIGVVYADAAGRVHEANPSLLAMLGLRPCRHRRRIWPTGRTPTTGRRCRPWCTSSAAAGGPWRAGSCA
jgi:integral membrane sensor domain MASE1/PAS domain-containing protein